MSIPIPYPPDGAAYKEAHAARIKAEADKAKQYHAPAIAGLKEAQAAPPLPVIQGLPGQRYPHPRK